MQIHSKLPNAGTTIFTVMSALAREHNAINLSQGFPDFECAPRLKELASHYIHKGLNQYAPMAGTIELRERCAEIMSMQYQAHYHPDTEITITAGATQAIYTAIATLVQPGDEVIVFEPAYDCYVPAIQVHGGIPVYCTLQAPDFSIDWEQVRKKINNKTKVILINSPHNPTGSVLSADDLTQLENLLRDTSIVLISDEVYEHMVFDNQAHQSICSRPLLRERAILVSSFGKTIHTTGWKIGYVAAPAHLTSEFRKIHQFLVFVVNHPLQLAIADYLKDPETYRELPAFYQRKRDLFLSLTQGSKLKPLKTRGTYFQLMDCSALGTEPDTELAIRLTKENKLAAIPLSVFYNQEPDRPLLRFCFAKKEETLQQAAEIINSL